MSNQRISPRQKNISRVLRQKTAVLKDTLRLTKKVKTGVTGKP